MGLLTSRVIIYVTVLFILVPPEQALAKRQIL